MTEQAAPVLEPIPPTLRSWAPDTDRDPPAALTEPVPTPAFLLTESCPAVTRPALPVTDLQRIWGWVEWSLLGFLMGAATIATLIGR
jgi:hypothetical protein